jgi:hypothetical protein
MKKIKLIFTLITLSILTLGTAAQALDTQALAIGARYHTEVANFGGVPFDDNDWSYILGYELRSSASYWQVGAMWAPEASLDPDIDDVITPFLNLMFYDKYVEAGFGIFDPYILRDECKDEWGDFSYQFILGIFIPMGKCNLKVDAYMPIYDWDVFSDFKFDNIEYAVWLNFTF